MPRESVYHKMSGGERVVAEQLKLLRLHWLYESPVFVTDDHNRPRVWSPDFFLPQLGVYIEVMGGTCNYDYRRTIYAKNNIPIVFTDPYTDSHWHTNLLNSITDIYVQRLRVLKQLFVQAA